MPITRIVSGAQTGADQGGLDAAIWCHVPHGGWVPNGRRCESGRIPDQYEGLQETESDEYVVRTEANVRDSDCTVVFTLGAATGGSLRTLEFCQAHQKPWLHLDIATLSRSTAANRICQWLRGELEMGYDFDAEMPEDVVLNVAGSRESKADGIQELVLAIMVDVFREMNEECRDVYPLPRIN